MKMIKSYIILLCLWLGTSCTLDLREDPNAVQPSQSLPSLVLNSMQRNLAGLFNGASTTGMIATRLQNSGGTTYANIWNPQSFDGMWSQAYATILLDGKQLIELADANGLARHAGIARVISAYTLLLLVDYFGDVPYTEALLGSQNFNPAIESGASVYDVALNLLNKAKEDLKTPTVALGGYLNATAPAITDLYYAGNYGNWVRLVNSLKLKIYLNLRLTKPAEATAGINAVIADPDGLISTAAQNFTFKYGTNQSDPDARHPRFVATYPAGGGNYMSNYLMWQMFHGYDAQANGAPGDPRMRFYFYRQTNANNTDPNNIRCVTAPSAPAHYPISTGTAILYNSKAGVPPAISTSPTHPAYYNPSGLPRTFCYPTNVGYWGRDHVDNQGIPPDQFLRTLWGAYPAGGRFDANNPANVNSNVGMRGAGIQPIMMRSFVNFMLAEAALYLGTSGNPRTYYQNGIQASFDDVRAFAVAGVEGSTINTFYPAATYTADVTAYITSALAAYDAQTGNDNIMNYIAREYWVAAFGNGVEAYNLYRRTGKPTGMQPALNDAPGEFPRSMYYPANFATRNSNVEQKTSLALRVFWDNNASDLNF
jgi:hypothetical protein